MLYIKTDTDKSSVPTTFPVFRSFAFSESKDKS